MATMLLSPINICNPPVSNSHMIIILFDRDEQSTATGEITAISVDCCTMSECVHQSSLNQFGHIYKALTGQWCGSSGKEAYVCVLVYHKSRWFVFTIHKLVGQHHLKSPQFLNKTYCSNGCWSPIMAAASVANRKWHHVQRVSRSICFNH